jgi:hypothetical protein
MCSGLRIVFDDPVLPLEQTYPHPSPNTSHNPNVIVKPEGRSLAREDPAFGE